MGRERFLAAMRQTFVEYPNRARNVMIYHVSFARRRREGRRAA